MSDWVTAKLKDVAKVVTGKTPQTSNSEYYGGDIPFVSPADLNEGILSETKTYLTSSGANQVYRVPKNTVLVSCIGNLGKLAITAKEVCFNQQINGLIFDEQKIFPKYGFYFAQTIKPQLEKASSSTTLPIVNKSRFSDLEIKYPPLDEQRRIAAILDQADELRQKRQQAIEKLDQLLQATFIDMFGDPVSNPKGFPIQDLEYIALQVTDGTHHTPKRETSGIPLLSARNVLMGRIDFENIDFVGEEEYQRLRKRCEPLRGDILISCSGSIGRVSTVDIDRPFVMVRSAALVKLNKKLVTSKFVEYLLRTPYLQSQMIRSSKSSSQANLFQEPIKRLKVFLPPIDLQENFEKLIEVSTKEKEKLLQSSDKLEILFRSLQNQAFNGTL